MWHFWIVGEKINRVSSYEVCSNVTSNSWLGRKDVWFLSFQYAIFFCDMVRAVISKRMDKRSHAWPRGKLIFAVYIFIFLHTFFVHIIPENIKRKQNRNNHRNNRKVTYRSTPSRLLWQAYIWLAIFQLDIGGSWDFGWIHSYRWITQVQNTGNRAENNTQFLVNLWMETYKQEVGGWGCHPPVRFFWVFSKTITR